MTPIGSPAAAVLALLLPVLPCPAAAGMPSMERLGGKTQTEAGALLMLSGIGQDWAAAIADIRSALGKGFFLETATASDSKTLQAAVDRLQARSVKKIVALPMLLSSHSAEMDENRYLFGIREHPSAEFLASPHAHSGYSVIRRIKSKVPIVLANALDDHPVLAEILAARALAHSKDPSKEALVLVVPSVQGDLANSQWAGTIESLAAKVRRTTGFKSVRPPIFPMMHRRTRATKLNRPCARPSAASEARGASSWSLSPYPAGPSGGCARSLTASSSGSTGRGSCPTRRSPAVWRSPWPRA